MTQKKDKTLYYIMAIMAGVFYGLAGPFTRVLMDGGLDNFTLCLQKNVYALVIYFVVLLITDKSKFRIKLQDIWVLALNGLIGIAGVGLTLYVAFKHLTLSFATVLLCMAPVFVLIFSAIFFKEAVTRAKLGCCIAAVFGCYMVSNMPGIMTGASVSFIGLIAGIGSALCYAGLSLFSKEATRRGYTALTVNFYSFIFSALLLLPFSHIGQIVTYASSQPLTHNLVLIGNAVCITFIPYMLQTTSLQHIEASKVSILGSAEPVSAMIFGLIFFAEVPTLVMIAGMFIVIFALFIVSKPQ
ncbi:MAG: DMT family transporter [Firmicutes bacterium]|nr:DMT family transporter [Bacillota bacterium]